MSVPTLIVKGDEDDPCLEPALMIKRTSATAACCYFPIRTRHQSVGARPSGWEAANRWSVGLPKLDNTPGKSLRAPPKKAPTSSVIVGAVECPRLCKNPLDRGQARARRRHARLVTLSLSGSGVRTMKAASRAC